MIRSDNAIDIDLLVLRDGSPTGLALVKDAFELATSLGWSTTGLCFRTRVVSPTPGRFPLRGGFEIQAHGLGAPAPIVFVVGVGVAAPEEIGPRLEQHDAATAARWLRGRAAEGSATAAACTGAFVLGEAGLLDGRRCTTTWWLAAALARRSPRARVDPDAMVIADGPVMTGGAATAHLDVALAIVAEHAGMYVARETARRLSSAIDRSQGEFVSAHALAAHSPVVGRVEAIVNRDLSARLSVADVAREMGVSGRTLHRQVRAATGWSASRLLQKIRLDAAIRMIRGGGSLAEVAARVGLADPSILSRLVSRHTGRAPGQFRAQERH